MHIIAANLICLAFCFFNSAAWLFDGLAFWHF